MEPHSNSQATRPRWRDEDDLAFLSFSLGPVQPFIAAARTVRDLWTGSYLLSYLTFEAMKPLLKEPWCRPEVSFLMPDVMQLPLWKARHDVRVTSEALRLPCTPNVFLAEVPRDQASDLAEACEQRCRDAWLEIAKAVHAQLSMIIKGAPEFADLKEGWDNLWYQQIKCCFEIRSVVLPLNEATQEAIDALLPPAAGAVGTHLRTRQLDLVGKMMQAKRSVRHVPGYFPSGSVPQKCTMLASYEQVGPARLNESRAFFEQLAKCGEYRGTRTDRRERLCAISLVKRYAWPCFLAGKLNQEPRDRRFADSATIAAAKWLKERTTLDPDAIWKLEGYWSGQWLHWKTRTDGADEGEQEVPRDVWDAIDKGRAQSKPPSYYAVLVLDGDHMGKWLRGEKCSQADPQTLQRNISQALMRFAVDRVPGTVDKHRGELIYSGGDDVLALLPTETALACAWELREAYPKCWPESLQNENVPTVSAGIAVVHYKEDLRLALEAARKAEKAAKNAGRDALGLSILRRSGEHTLALMVWQEAQPLQDLIDLFLDKVTDRWTYVLRRELPSLVGDHIPAGLFEAELKRLLNRVEDRTHKVDLMRLTEKLWADYETSMSDEKRHRKREQIYEDFVTICQSGAFLARGRDTR